MDKLWAVPQAVKPSLPAPETQGNASGPKVSVAHDQRILISSYVTILKPLIKSIVDLLKMPHASRLCHKSPFDIAPTAMMEHI